MARVRTCSMQEGQQGRRHAMCVGVPHGHAQPMPPCAHSPCAHAPCASRAPMHPCTHCVHCACFFGLDPCHVIPRLQMRAVMRKHARVIPLVDHEGERLSAQLLDPCSHVVRPCRPTLLLKLRPSCCDGYRRYADIMIDVRAAIEP